MTEYFTFLFFKKFFYFLAILLQIIFYFLSISFHKSGTILFVYTAGFFYIKLLIVLNFELFFLKIEKYYKLV